AVHRGERAADRRGGEGLARVARAGRPRHRRLGDRSGPWPQARTRAPGALHRARERPGPVVLRAVGDVSSLRAFGRLGPQPQSLAEVTAATAGTAVRIAV